MKFLKLRPELSLLVAIEVNSQLQGIQYPGHALLHPASFEPSAVATAISIARGSSFTILKAKRRPKPVIALSSSVNEEGFHVDPAQLANAQDAERGESTGYIVYKVAEIDFDDTGIVKPEYRASLAAVLTELLVLSHKPVTEHKYIQKLLGMAWGHNSFSVTQRIPIPIVDFARHGSLADYQGRRNLHFKKKRQICWAMASALDFLHSCDIIHGDIKTENVLLFDGPDGLLPQLSDFGQSVVSDYGYFDFVPTGTPEWASPELRWQGSEAVDLKKADTYSFGLMMWRVFCDGRDPLSRRILTRAVLEHKTYSGAVPYSERPASADLRFLCENDRILNKALSLSWLPEESRWSFFGVLDLEAAARTELLHNWWDMLREKDFSWLRQALESTLSRLPAYRDLKGALRSLSQGEEYRKISPDYAPIDIKSQGAFEAAAQNEFSMNWTSMRYLDPSVRDSLFNQRLARETEADASGLLLGNAACMLSGLGSDRYFRPQEALDRVATEAKSDNTAAIALLYRLNCAFSKDVPEDIDLLDGLQRTAISGSVAALEDLAELAPERMIIVKTALINYTCGIGSQIFFPFNTLNGWSFANRTDVDWMRKILECNSDPWKIAVNRRGDNLLNAAVSLNHEWLVLDTVEKYSFPINHTNNEGETALLCSLRSGLFNFAVYLLDRGADPCLTSNSGESPMHWSLGVTSFGCRAIVGKLIEKGGLPTLTSWVDGPLRHAAVDVAAFHMYSERLCSGTPLHWAICRKKQVLVDVLMSHGAPADFSGPSAARSQRSPLELASYLYEVDILRLIIEKHASKRNLVGFHLRAKYKNSPWPEGAGVFQNIRGLIRSAIDGSDRFSLLVRHGERYKTKMRRLFQLLWKELKYVSFLGGVDHEGRTLLQYACFKGYEEAAEHILEFWNGGASINVPWLYEWTPICEAIRRNHCELFDLLVRHGADLDIRVQDSGGRPIWRLLHLASVSVVGNDLTIIRKLLDHDGDVEGGYDEQDPRETPLSLAIDNNHFELADLLRSAGAHIDATSRYVLGGRLRLKHQTTILGRVIAANIRHPDRRLQYLLYLTDTDQPSYIVAPEIGMTALQMCIAGEEVFEQPEERDPETAHAIFDYLLEKYDTHEELNMRTMEAQQTALHYAVTHVRLHHVQRLLNMDEIDLCIRDGENRTALDIAKTQNIAAENNAMISNERRRYIREIYEILEKSLHWQVEMTLE